MSRLADCILCIYEAIKKGDMRQAIALVDNNIQEYEENIDFLKAEALLCEQLKEYEAAILILNKVKKKKPDDYGAYQQLVECYEKMSALEKRKENIIVVDTDKYVPLTYNQDMDLYDNRQVVENVQRNVDDPLVSIFFLAYNNLENLTKPALKCLLQYTSNVDYELILIDNGSTDGTFEYFKELKIKRKTIYRITKNIGGLFGFSQIERSFFSKKARGEYIVYMPNDVRVTKNWLYNMIVCAKDNRDAGIIVPLCDNCSNCQTINLGYTDFDDMQEKAAMFNISDSRKWQERMRIIPVVCLLPRAACQLNHFYDTAFVYSFADDDMSINYRRNGYKLILCGDTFIHHEGSSVVGKNVEKNKMDLLMGREAFRKKHHGIDPWDDMNNYEWIMCQQLLVGHKKSKNNKEIKLLGVDVRCGMPLLNLKNKLHFLGEDEIVLSAYTQDGKYWLDLKSICNGAVYCGDASDIGRVGGNEKYDYIICGELVDTYKTNFSCVQNFMTMLKKDGRLVIKFRNFPRTTDLNDILTKMGKEDTMKYGLVNVLKRFAEKHNYKVKALTLALAQEDEVMWEKIVKIIEGNLDKLEDMKMYSKEKFAFVKGQYIVVLEQGNGDN